MAPRRTFVVRVYADGSLSVQDVRTGRQAAIADLNRVVEQIRRWLDERDGPNPSNVFASEDPRLES